MTISICLTTGRSLTVLGNMAMPFLVNLGCAPPFLLLSSFILRKYLLFQVSRFAKKNILIFFYFSGNTSVEYHTKRWQRRYEIVKIISYFLWIQIIFSIKYHVVVLFLNLGCVFYFSSYNFFPAIGIYRSSGKKMRVQTLKF